MQKVVHREFNHTLSIEGHDKVLKKRYSLKQKRPFASSNDFDKKYTKIPELDVLHEAREEDVEDY